MVYQAVRGTKDLFFSEAEKFSFIKETAAAVCQKYGFSEAITPIFEFVEVFKGHLGDETSEIVNKEMYLLQSRGGETLALRPEGTAPLVRMLLSNKLTHNLPLKFFYLGPMFRYERPQKGRQRQFYQFGVEHFLATTPLSDVLILLMAKQILDGLKIANYSLEINNLGTKEEQQNYSQSLKQYLTKYKNELSLDSQNRLLTNPLRILDSKDENDQKILQEAPSVTASLGRSSLEYFNNILAYLKSGAVNYKISPRLVRGLDYYTGLVFEFTSNSLGSQNAIIAGGRYNNLVKNMGGADIPAIGFAAGVERLMLLLNSYFSKETTKVAILSLTSVVDGKTLDLFKVLVQEQQIVVEFIEEGSNLAKKLKKANKLNFNFAIIVGEEELKNNKVIIKDLQTGLQKSIDNNNITTIINFIKNQ